MESSPRARRCSFSFFTFCRQATPGGAAQPTSMPMHSVPAAAAGLGRRGRLWLRTAGTPALPARSSCWLRPLASSGGSCGGAPAQGSRSGGGGTAQHRRVLPPQHWHAQLAPAHRLKYLAAAWSALAATLSGMGPSTWRQGRSAGGGVAYRKHGMCERQESNGPSARSVPAASSPSAPGSRGSGTGRRRSEAPPARSPRSRGRRGRTSRCPGSPQAPCTAGGARAAGQVGASGWRGQDRAP